MTDAQKKSIIEYFNAARSELIRAEELMDHPNAKIARKGDTSFERAMTRMQTIDHVLFLLDMALVTDDEDVAIDIK